MWEDLLKSIWGDAEGWAITACILDDKFRHRAYRYPDDLDVLLSDLRGYNTWGNIYFYPIITPEGERKKEDIKETSVLWIDKDAGSVSDLQPRPTICWETSEDKYQAIWKLAEPISADRAERINRYLTYKLGGDRGCWDIAHILRVPGSRNYKYDPPHEGTILWTEGPIYNVKELEPTEREVERLQREVKEANVPNIPDNLPSYSEVITEYGSIIPKAVWKILNEVPDEDADWSKQLWKMERLLLQAKVPVEAVFVLARDSNWNKYARDDRPDEHLWQEIWKAQMEEDTKEEEQEERRLKWMGLRDLLVLTERPEWLVEGVWMESNVGWIAGVGKSFKSVISLDLGLSIASGDDFLDTFEVKNPGPVMMVQEEDPEWRVANRIQAMAAAKGISAARLEELDDGLLIEMPSGGPVPFIAAIGSNFSFLDEEFVDELEFSLYQYKPRMVILDPWFMMTPGMDEFKSSEITAVLKTIKRWRNEFGCAVAIVHHYRKGSGQSHERLYGSQALYAWSENTLFVDRDKKSNLVKVERDIKDADYAETQDFNVSFHDISSKYIFNVLDEAPKDSSDTILAFLREKPVGTQITKAEISEALGLSGKTTRKRMRELDEAGRVQLKRVGRGGKMAIITMPELYKMEGVEADVSQYEVDN